MPIHHGTDKDGPFVQWGHCTKYHYKKNNKKSLNAAKKKAQKQAAAIFANGYVGESIFEKLYEKILIQEGLK